MTICYACITLFNERNKRKQPNQLLKLKPLLNGSKTTRVLKRQLKNGVLISYWIIYNL